MIANATSQITTTEEKQLDRERKLGDGRRNMVEPGRKRVRAA
jgi:hypothetical protein